MTKIMSASNPLVTVLLPVYNGERFFRGAIESILSQTYTNFELLIIDDGSTDRSLEIASSYDDKRIKIIRNKTNLGISASLNKGMRLAQGKYIARMDADDISLPDRLEKQIDFLTKNPKIVLCGTAYKTIGGPPVGDKFFVQSPELIKCGLLFRSMFAHPTVMLRRTEFIESKLFYDEKDKWAEDYGLWVRCAEHYSMSNLREVLFLRRSHSSQINIVHAKEMAETSRRIKLRQLRKIGIIPTAQELDVHVALGSGMLPENDKFTEGVDSWLEKLRQANKRVLYYNDAVFSCMLDDYWLNYCLTKTKSEVKILHRFIKSSNWNRKILFSRKFVKFLLSCLFHSL